MRNIQYFEELENYLLQRNLEKIWSYKNDFKVGLSYSMGLILTVGKPLLKVIQTETGIKAINLSEFLRKDYRYWELEGIFQREVELIEDDGEILLDEVIHPKENTTKMDAHYVHCSSQKRVLKGQEYLVLVWNKGNKTIVIDFLQVKKDDDRLSLSIKMVEKFLETGKKVKGLRADGWFFKEDFVKNLRKLQMGLISKPRKDSWWYLGTELIQLKEYAKTIKSESFHYYRKQGVYAKSIVVSNQKYYTCKIVIIKPKHSSKPEDYVFIASTEANLTNREIIKGYKNRWKIEVVFRDCSQHLGLKHCQAQNGASETHVALVFLTYNFLSAIKEKVGGTIGKVKRNFIRLCKPLPTNILAFNKLERAA